MVRVPLKDLEKLSRINGLQVVSKWFYPKIQSGAHGPCPASGDTGVFRERGGAEGVCRVEETAGN